MIGPTPSKRPFIVPVFLPHAGCPHRCLFCNQHATTGQEDTLPSARTVRKTITDFLAHRRDPTRFTEISFYGGNFLGLPPEQIQLLLATAAAFVHKGRVNGIRFSTRPDTIDAKRLDLIAPYPVTTIELGVQSMQDDVLERSARGHTADDTRRAVALLAGRPYALGLQMMVGLPGDTTASALATARQLAGLSPDFVRIYPAVV
jgi:histone acetyltransferase (RNA polymerase elongator complex component)